MKIWRRCIERSLFTIIKAIFKVTICMLGFEFELLKWSEIYFENICLDKINIICIWNVHHIIIQVGHSSKCRRENILFLLYLFMKPFLYPFNFRLIATGNVAQQTNICHFIYIWCQQKRKMIEVLESRINICSKVTQITCLSMQTHFVLLIYF